MFRLRVFKVSPGEIVIFARRGAAAPTLVSSRDALLREILDMIGSLGLSDEPFSMAGGGGVTGIESPLLWRSNGETF